MGKELVIIGSKPKNFDSFTTANNVGSIGIKSNYGNGNGLSHIPDTTQGSAIAFAKGMIRSIAKDGFTFVAGEGLDISKVTNCGWSN